ncbi:hypothetical protein P43SY_001426 [Pythium insidiosum]|uniref:Uncharacterized protein n=1 Tax=Pythium insidiosum TaxID=114742 RepID=A0AAD5M884_PYTIN|nr:hypothetical protein P43SY_001426 [Pythium insidiosum]
MQVESKHVRLLPDGKRLVELTVGRSRGSKDSGADESRLVVPEFDEDDSSSSSDEEKEEEEEEKQGDHQAPSSDGLSNNDAAFQGEFQWNGVQDIQELTHTNARLQSQVHDLHGQVKTLQIQLEALAPIPGFNAAAIQDILLDKDGVEHDVRDAKIVHQARTLRHLKRTLQREKQLAVDAVKQRQQAERERERLEAENETLQLKLARFHARAVAAGTAPTAAEAGASSDTTASKDSTLRRKYEDLRVKMERLQHDLRRTQRALVREVGEDVPLEELLEASDSASGKRGRAQQIVMLKAKVKKLEQQLQAQSTAAGETENQATSQDADRRVQQELARQHAQRQKALDRVTAERDELRERVQELSKRQDALKSRAQVLEKEKQDAKAKLQLLVDKSRNDDALVDALQRQLETWKGKCHDARRARTADSAAAPSNPAAASAALSKDERQELERLRSMVNDPARRSALGASASAGGMPAPSEAAQYRTAMAEKERLVEVVKALQTQLEDKERQLRQQQPQEPHQLQPQPPESSASSGSRIPRLTRSPHGPPAPSDAVEVMRKSFRDTLIAKEQEIEMLKAQVRDQAARGERTADDDARHQELSELQEENALLRHEFDRLKTRYEALLQQRDSKRS